jgi:hypothetical protein
LAGPLDLPEYTPVAAGPVDAAVRNCVTNLLSLLLLLLPLWNFKRKKLENKNQRVIDRISKRLILLYAYRLDQAI